MAVYERAYRGYAGELTPTWSRFLILPRYAYREVFASKLFSIFFAGCFLVPVAFAIYIYLHHNLTALAMIRLPESALSPINAKFFGVYAWFQSILAFLLAMFVGPALVAPDLASNGLALYLCRPFSRAEYVVGKMSVLVILLSLITWIPGMLLFLFQSSLDGFGWVTENLRIAAALLTGFGVWILVLCLMTLAASAWVKRKFLAAALLLGTFFVSKAMAVAINGTLLTIWGDVLDLSGLIFNLWAHLLGTEPPTEIPLTVAVGGLGAFCGFCLWLLARKVRAYEVVR